MADRLGSEADTKGDEAFARQLDAIGEKSRYILSELLERRGSMLDRAPTEPSESALPG